MIFSNLSRTQLYHKTHCFEIAENPLIYIEQKKMWLKNNKSILRSADCSYNTEMMMNI